MPSAYTIISKKFAVIPYPPGKALTIARLSSLVKVGPCLLGSTSLEKARHCPVNGPSVGDPRLRHGHAPAPRPTVGEMRLKDRRALLGDRHASDSMVRLTLSAMHTMAVVVEIR